MFEVGKLCAQLTVGSVCGAGGSVSALIKGSWSTRGLE